MEARIETGAELKLWTTGIADLLGRAGAFMHTARGNIQAFNKIFCLLKDKLIKVIFLLHRIDNNSTSGEEARNDSKAEHEPDCSRSKKKDTSRRRKRKN